MRQCCRHSVATGDVLSLEPCNWGTASCMAWRGLLLFTLFRNPSLANTQHTPACATLCNSSHFHARVLQRNSQLVRMPCNSQLPQFVQPHKLPGDSLLHAMHSLKYTQAPLQPNIPSKKSTRAEHRCAVTSSVASLCNTRRAACCPGRSNNGRTTQAPISGPQASRAQFSTSALLST